MSHPSGEPISFPGAPRSSRVWMWVLAVIVTLICLDGIVTSSSPGPVIAAIVIVCVWVIVARFLLMRPSQILGSTLRYHGFLRSRDIQLAGARELELRVTKGSKVARMVQPSDLRKGLLQSRVSNHRHSNRGGYGTLYLRSARGALVRS